ncbi:MAG: transposase [Halioglobus sp.]|jgi:transposase
MRLNTLRPGIHLKQVFLYTDGVDFRRGHRGLASLIEHELGHDPFSGTLYLFANRQRNKVKCLFWEENFFVRYYKALAEERFRWPQGKDSKAQKKPRPKRKGLNPDITRVQHRLLLSDEQRQNAIDTFFVTVKEELDITPAQVQVIEILQEKAVYLDENGKRNVVAAAREPHPLGKSVASVSLLAYLVIAKYCDDLPLYRLKGILKRYGGTINRSTMAGWLIRLAQQLQCVVNLMQEVQLSADYLQGDETRLQVLKEDGMDPTGSNSR